MMRPGFQFELVDDDTRFRVVYSGHFVDRYEVGEPERGRAPVKATVAESEIRAKIEEAIPQIAEIAAGDPDAEGVIVSRGRKFVMLFAVIERQDGFQLTLVTTSPGLNFRAKSPKDYIITVNPTYEVVFVPSVSYGLKVAILADLAANAEVLEDGGMFHLGADLMDYWVERSGDRFHVVSADWRKPLYEVQVT